MSVLYTDIDPFCCEVLRARVADGGLPHGEVWERDVTTLVAAELAPFAQVHLFCGIGGIPLGLKWAGWPDDWPIVTGGFPCQDVSVAGKGLGVEGGARSGLWKEMHRVIDLVRPTWVLAENVPALRTRGADRVLGDLEQLGYACWPLVVGAEHVGAPHRRHRVWIVGVADTVRDDGRGIGRKAGRGRGVRSTGEAGMADADGCRRGVDQQGRGADRGTAAGRAGEGVAHTPGGGRLGADGRTRTGDGHADECGAAVDNAAGARCAGDADSLASRSIRVETRRPASRPHSGGGILEHTLSAGREERHAPALSERAGLRGWPMPPGPHQHPWEAPRLIESSVGIAVDGLPRRLAGYLRRSGLKALGNAVVPEVVEVVARGMIAFGKSPESTNH